MLRLLRKEEFSIFRLKTFAFAVRRIQSLHYQTVVDKLLFKNNSVTVTTQKEVTQKQLKIYNE